MQFDVSEEDKLIIDGLRRFNDQVSVPLEQAQGDLFTNGRRTYDESGREVPKVRELKRQVRMESAKAGFYAVALPKELGGGGRGASTTFHAWLLIHSAYGPEYQLPENSVSHWALGPGPMLLGLKDPCRSEVLPSLISGGKGLALGISEESAGADPWMMTTRAVRDGDGWIINGTKQIIHDGPYAEYVLVFAITDPQLATARQGGISCFFVDTKSPGYSTSVIRIWGEVGGNAGSFSLDNVRVPDYQLVGELGQGFRLAMSGAAHGRLYMTARAVGMAQWALRKATKYSQERIAFGGPIASNQGVSFMLAETAIEIHAAQCMGLHLAYLIDKGERVVKEMNMTKAFAAEMAFRAYDRAIQVYGGMGVTNEVGLYKGLETVRLFRIGDGTSEILRRTIAQELFRGNLD